MTATRTRAEIGKANHRKGKDTEQKVARYLREHGFPNADRTGHVAYRTAERERPDQLDITGTPGIAWSVKADHTRKVRAWLAEADDVCVRDGHDLAVLVCRRDGKASPADWWAWLPYSSLIVLETGAIPRTGHDTPVCMELRDLLPLLWTAGYAA